MKQENNKCPQNDEYSCKDRSQCSEPCGDLGNQEKRSAVKPRNTLLLFKDKVK